ncbi:hypothetical protein DPX16_9000 [Anabarilius grahami]|uniref:Uncharacterized protein n=1 Tax=Anabarilius grahami TaxID=495550 RepID=A0A3N0XEG3_ANAGA|nr:hypothetical protein DPX16_9000 [Anabarilius grahami]
MIRWPDGPTSSNADSTFRIGRKKADEDQLQPTVWNTLRKLSRPVKKNCLTADRRLERNHSSSRPLAAPFLTHSHGSCSPPRGTSQTHSSSAHITARGALAAGRDDVKHERHRHPLVLSSRGEVRERECNSLKPPNELISSSHASAQMGPESPGTDADSSSLGKSAKRERSVLIGRRSQ